MRSPFNHARGTKKGNEEGNTGPAKQRTKKARSGQAAQAPPSFSPSLIINQSPPQPSFFSSLLLLLQLSLTHHHHHHHHHPFTSIAPSSIRPGWSVGSGTLSKYVRTSLLCRLHYIHPPNPGFSHRQAASAGHRFRLLDLLHPQKREYNFPSGYRIAQALQLELGLGLCAIFLNYPRLVGGVVLVTNRSGRVCRSLILSFALLSAWAHFASE